MFPVTLSPIKKTIFWVTINGIGCAKHCQVALLACHIPGPLWYFSRNFTSSPRAYDDVFHLLGRTFWEDWFLLQSRNINVLNIIIIIQCSNWPPRSGELRTQKIKSHLMRTQSLKVLPLKPGVDQYTALHATLTARDFFLANFYPTGPFTFIFSKTSSEIFLC